MEEENETKQMEEEGFEQEIEESPEEKPIEQEQQEQEQKTKPETKPVEDEIPVQEEVIDYRDDVRGWMNKNNKAMDVLERKLQGLLVAYDTSIDFLDGLRRISGKEDMDRYMLELLRTFMRKYEKVSDENFANEISDYIMVNTNELGRVQKKIYSLINVYDYAEDFLYGLDPVEPEKDLARGFMDHLRKFVEDGLE